MDITIVGHVCIDRNEVENAKYEAAGSPAIFITKILKQFPDTSIKVLSHQGLDFEKYNEKTQIYPKVPQFKKTLVYKNIVKNKKRTQYALNRYNSPPINTDSKVIQILKNTDILFVSPILANYPTDFVNKITRFNSNTLKILLPQGYFRRFDGKDRVGFREFKEASDLLYLFDFTILSDEDYPDIANLSKKWLNGNKSKVIITKGKDGADLISGADLITKTKVINFPTKEAPKIVDSTGSGDIFSASFAYKFFQTRDDAKSIEFANKVAGYCLRYKSYDIRIDKRIIK
ncbi:carbohydrate kinase family protein [Candidatus Dojkabacteria bacterium]|nr:carbohydrate kinase family protein [Candidatus Dojkabacteria bacterium]